MGSLNGTLLNSKSINRLDTERRHWGDPMNLANGDVITLGTTSKIIVSMSFEGTTLCEGAAICLCLDFLYCHR